MAKNKTTETTTSVDDFINNIVDETKRKDSAALIQFLQQHTGFEPKMWGTSIIGFGSYHYKYDSGREGNSSLVGFSPRATALTLYLSGNFESREQLLEKLGKHKTEKGCIYIKKLADVDLEVLRHMVENHIKYIQTMYPNG
jgi:hypothetical protein